MFSQLLLFPKGGGQDALPSELHRIVILQVAAEIGGRERASHAHRFFAGVPDEVSHSRGQMDGVPYLHGKHLRADLNLPLAGEDKDDLLAFRVDVPRVADLSGQHIRNPQRDASGTDCFGVDEVAGLPPGNPPDRRFTYIYDMFADKISLIYAM